MDLIISTILPVVTKDLPIPPRFTPYNFLSRCKFSTLTTRQPMVEFYLLTFPRFPLGPVLTMFRKSKSEKIKIKIGLWLVEVQNLLTTPVYFLEIAAIPKKSPETQCLFFGK